MGYAYIPGLKVAEKTIVRKKRLLPIPGEVKVKKGDIVTSSEIIAKTELPGKIHSINVVNILGIAQDEINQFMIKKEGDSVKKDEIIAESKSFIKWLKTVVKSPIDGTVESISNVTGQVLLRELPKALELHAYIDGEVIEIIEGQGAIIETFATYIQGIFGIGGERTGIIEMVAESPEEVLTQEKISNNHRGKIIVGGSLITSEGLSRAKEVGVEGVIVGGVNDQALSHLLGYDLGVAITGMEEVGFTLILTEGFGKISMAKKTFDLLSSKHGKRASISGQTQIRAGVIRPEIIIFDPKLKSEDIIKEDLKKDGLRIGDLVRIIRNPYFGIIGKVRSLPIELQRIETETNTRVLEVELQDGKSLIIPRANVEIIQ